MVTQMAEKMAFWLATQSGKTSEVQKLRYSIEILIAGIFKLFCLFFGAYLLGVSLELFFLICTFSFFRIFSGGFHLRTYARCLLTGMVLMLGLSFISLKLSPIVTESMLKLAIVFSIIFGFYSCFRFAPATHFYRKLTEQKSELLRKIALVGVFIWGLTLFLLLPILSSSIILSSSLGFILQMWSINPNSYRLIDYIEKRLN